MLSTIYKGCHLYIGSLGINEIGYMERRIGTCRANFTLQISSVLGEKKIHPTNFYADVQKKYISFMFFVMNLFLF